MNEKQRIAEIRQGAASGVREGYLRASGTRTLPAMDVDELLKRIDRLEFWIKEEAQRSDVCTWEIFGEACDGCRCHRARYEIAKVTIEDGDPVFLVYSNNKYAAKFESLDLAMSAYPSANFCLTVKS